MHYQNDSYAYQALSLAVQKLNTSFSPSEIAGGLESMWTLEFFIIYWNGKCFSKSMESLANK
jgi:hypothetical protein